MFAICNPILSYCIHCSDLNYNFGLIPSSLVADIIV